MSFRKERVKRTSSTRGNFLLEFKETLISQSLCITLRKYNGALDRSPLKLPANDSHIYALYPCKRVSKHEKHGHRVYERDTTFEAHCSRTKIVTADVGLTRLYFIPL